MVTTVFAITFSGCLLLKMCRLSSVYVVTHCFPHPGPLPSGGLQTNDDCRVKLLRMVDSEMKDLLSCAREFQKVNWGISKNKLCRVYSVDSPTVHPLFVFVMKSQVVFPRVA